ncbi:MAG: hypothetical protein EHM81_03500 [Chloroflexi bacterium]|nr:MAG: hypothetical protein EHM81_03500 [Chloroflexota bacterium]
MGIANPLRVTEQLYFMHIPKCAGMSLIAVLDQYFTIDEICPLHDTFKNFQAYTPEQMAAFRFIRGHFPYKLIDLLPGRPRTLTILRHPVKRVISAIAQHRRLEEQGVPFFKESVLNLSTEEFMKHPTFGKAVSNVSVKYLNDVVGPAKDPISLSRAKERLESFDVIGLVEQFDDSLNLLSHTFGFEPIAEAKEVNVDPKRSSKSEIHQYVLDLIVEMNKEEIELYEFGVQLFRERLAQMKAEQAQPTALITIPAPTRLDFHQVSPGQGWYSGLKHPKYGVLRWSGPETTSYLRIPLKAREHTLRFKVLKAIAPEILKSLVVEVNGSVIPLKTHWGGEIGSVIVEGKIPGSVINPAGKTTISFKVSRTLPFKSLASRLLYRSKQRIPAIEDNQWVGRFFPLEQFHFRYSRLKTSTIDNSQRVGLLYQWIEIRPE